MKESPPLQIQCFGGFHVILGEEPITAFNTDKVRALFIYLVTEAGQMFQRSHLAGLLWSDISEEQAMHNLRQALSLLRKALKEEDQSFVFADRDKVGIQPNTNLKADSLDFTRLMEEAYRYHNNKDGLGTINIVALKQAIHLYRNPFLDRYHLNVSPLFDEWLLITREKFDSSAVEGLVYLAEYYDRRNEITNAIQMLRKIIHIMPWDERAHYQLIHLLAKDHQWSVAQKQYASLVQYLKNDLNVSPDPKTVVLFEKVRAQSLSEKNTEPDNKLLHNLPLLTSAFVGRENELASLSELIANPIHRLVNILGLGGIGKTRLGVEIAFLQLGVFQQGVFMVALRNIESFDGLLTEIGQILQIKFSDLNTKEQQIFDYCRLKQLLLLLDNLDDLSGNQQLQIFLEAMVRDCPKVMILVTSRQKVNISEETIFQLDGLDFEEQRGQGVHAILQSDAVILFEQRVRTTQRRFEITLENRNTILKLCKLVEGHPLAIELVAGSVSGKVEERIEETIEQGMGAFISALANQQQHHQTLAAVFEVSWQRLTSQEQSDLACFAVFKGGFSGDTVQHIFNINAHRLLSLIDKSLLRVNFQGRYDLHEIVRQFGELKCKQSGEWENCVRGLSEYYLKFIQEQATRFEAGEQSFSLDCIELELDNVKVAWDWIMQTNQFPLLITFIDVLYQYFNIRSRFMQGINWFEGLKNRIEDHADHLLLHAMVLNRIGSLAYRARQNEIAQRTLSYCYELLLPLNNDCELALCLVGLGGIELRRKNFQKALEHASSSIQRYQNVLDKSGEAYAAYLKGLVLNRMADYQRAEIALQHSLSLSREIKNERRMVSPLNLLGDIACIKGQPDKAEIFFKEALEISINLGDRFNQAILLNNLATVFHARKDFPKEKKSLLESLAICEDIGDQDGIALAYNNLGEMSIQKGDFDEAIQYAEKGLAIAHQIGEEWTIIVSLNNLGEAYAGLNHLDKAMDFLKQAISMAYEIESMDMVTRVAVNIGRVKLKQGNREIAQEWLQATIVHSAIEYEHQQKAIRILEENQVNPVLTQDDEFLENIVSAYCGKK